MVLMSSNSNGAAWRKERLICEPPEMVVPARPSLPPMAVLELSNLDHIYNFHNSSLLFYPANSQKKSTIDVEILLRKALPELLNYYPAAAGRLRVSPCGRRLEIECNDQGLQFVSARARMALSELGDVSEGHPWLDLLVPAASFDRQPHENGPPIVAMQVTTFECGSVVLSISSNHAYFDAYSAALFLVNLASLARGEGISIAPETVSRRKRMPARTLTTSTTLIKHPLILKKEEKKATIVPGSPPMVYGNVTRISFSADALEDLRHAVLTAGHNRFSMCSRYQALVALIWKARGAIVRAQIPEDQDSMEMPLRIPVNLRGKVLPDLTQGYVGNGLYPVTVSASVKELREAPLHKLVHKVQMAIEAVTPEQIEILMDYLEGGEGPLGSSMDPAFFGMSSLVSLPFYDIDFGWGKPSYSGLPSRQKSNRVYFLDGGAQGGGWHVLAVFLSSKERSLFSDTLAAHVAFSM